MLIVSYINNYGESVTHNMNMTKELDNDWFVFEKNLYNEFFNVSYIIPNWDRIRLSYNKILASEVPLHILHYLNFIKYTLK